MKKILFTIAVLGITMQAQSQITEKSDGKVGIGTTVPSSKLHVNYATTSGEISKNGINSVLITQATTNVTSYDKGIYSSIGNFGIAPNITDTGYKIGLDASAFSSSINFKGTLNSNFGVWARAGIYNATPGAKINLAVGLEAQVLDNVAGTTIENAYGVRISTGAYNKTTVTNRYDLYAGTVNANNYFAGNVGVGINKPQAKLNVVGTFQVGEIENPDSGILSTSYESGSLHLNMIEFDDPIALSFKQTINPSYSDKFYYHQGNFGIGINNPSEKFEIYNSTTTPGTISLRSSRNDAGNVDVGRVSAKQGTIEVSRIGMPRGGGGHTGYLTFWTKETNSSSLKESMRINEKGNVGIGTLTTGDHKLAVNGSIGAREIKVETKVWPDYVFMSDYNLPTLTEVEKHIQEKGHLANIPSAKEVEKAGGIELGSMNKKLLQKVEELTLYTIQQEKQLQKQAKEMQELKELVNKLIQKNK
ncbi:hypothetical protein [Tenacibaculum halocynthiae]|uniref:hypothetical protein n=1 Tax=Tenacibaculum halocynthiae TaxID=1254437 RepID=UPI003893BCA9